MDNVDNVEAAFVMSCTMISTSTLLNLYAKLSECCTKQKRRQMVS